MLLGELFEKVKMTSIWGIDGWDEISGSFVCKIAGFGSRLI
jgi:hypothetical protein